MGGPSTPDYTVVGFFVTIGAVMLTTLPQLILVQSAPTAAAFWLIGGFVGMMLVGIVIGVLIQRAIAPPDDEDLEAEDVPSDS
ncbi:MAG: hypothetical protein AAF125_11070 [Chloroflexota bacterium]